MIFKLGITGSEDFELKQQIKEIIFNLKNKFGNEIIVYTLGSIKGTDSFVKKYCIEFGINFAEFTPNHLSKTLYSVEENDKNYLRPYSKKDIYKRSIKMVKTCHAFILFKYEDDKVIDFMIDQITKTNKKYKLIEKYEAVGIRGN